MNICEFPFYCVHGRNSVYPLIKLREKQNLKSKRLVLREKRPIKF